MSSCDRVVILFISGTLALTTGACSRLKFDWDCLGQMKMNSI
ncbi:hypothetical protein [Coleofasciculus sp. E1-EBD-02]